MQVWFEPLTAQLMLLPSSSGGSGSPSLPFNSVQFNNAGSFGGDVGLTYNPTLTSGNVLDLYHVNTATSGDYTGISSGVIANPSANRSGNLFGFFADVESDPANTKDINRMYGYANYIAHRGSGQITDRLFGYLSDIEVLGGAVSNLTGFSAYVNAAGGNINSLYGVDNSFSWTSGVISTRYGFKDGSTPLGATVTTSYSFYAADQASATVTNPYYFWLDSQGVFRIREDNVADGSSNPQAILALYNPRFTKYTPGATNHERVVLQWVNNVATFGTEAGGTGTLRNLNFIGTSILANGAVIATVSNKLSVFASTTSAELAGVISDETGSGLLVFATSPTLTTPILGVATATSINKVTITTPTNSATLTIADGKTLTVSNTLTFTGTDSSSVNFGAGGTVQYTGITKRISIINFASLPDTSGNVWFEPAALTQTNDRYPQMAIRFKDTATKDSIGIRFMVPSDYVGNAKIYFLCTSTATSGNFVVTLDYSSASVTSSLDPSADEESLSVTQAAPASSQTGVFPFVTLTAANLAANDVFQGKVSRNGTSGSDTMAADLMIYDIIFEYTN